MNMHSRKYTWALTAGLFSLILFIAGCSKDNDGGSPKTVRLGYFPNVTHAQALIGVSRGDFQKSLGPDIKLESQTLNAGPSVIEALFAGHLDIAYIGPSPTLNGFLQSKGEEVRVVAGSATNGVLVVGSKKRDIKTLQQLKGKKVATPQLGNTQDISAKYYVKHDLQSALKSEGGDTDVMPIANPDIETLFEKDQLDAAWVPEPWGSRLISKGLAVLIDEEKNLWPNKSFPITNIIARREFLEKNPELVQKVLEAHVRITRELQADPQSFATELNDEIKRLTSKALPPEVIEGALKYTGFDVDTASDAFEKFFDMGKEIGIIKADKLDLGKLIVTDVIDRAVTAVDGEGEGETSETVTSDTTTSGTEQ